MDDKIYYIYKLTDPEGKVYIGSTMQTPKERWDGGSGYIGQPFYLIVKKFGWNNIQKEILEIACGKENADIKEREYISFYNSTDSNFGHNMENGGNIGKVLAKETKEKISKTLKEKRIVPPSRKGIPNKNRKAVICTDKSGNLIGEYNSIKEASSVLGIHSLKISNVVNKRYKHVRNYCFMTKEEYYEQIAN